MNLAKIPDEMLEQPHIYNEVLKDMGLFDIELTRENQYLLDLYNKVIDPTNLTINYSDYFLFCYLDDYNNSKNGADLLVHIRNTLSNYRNKKDELSKKRIEEKERYESDNSKIRRG
jgi:hypothetical protein